MQNEKIYITLNHMDQFKDYPYFIKAGDELTLRKDINNTYDDEAIIASKGKTTVAFVANSVHSVARGTFSAGRIYDLVAEEAKCIVRFVLMEEEVAIAELCD